MEEIEDWVVDSDSYDMKRTDQRYLSRHPIEQLWVSPNKTKLLLLVNINDDATIFGGKGNKINSMQNIDQCTIAGKQYYRLKCTIEEGNYDMLDNGPKTKMYSEARFKYDFKYRRGGIQVQFDGTTETHSFLWNDIIDYPSTFMFFGAPLTQSRAFDTIFHTSERLDTLHHRFMTYYKEFEGDIQSCYALYNAYLHKRAFVFAKQVGKLQRQQKDYDGKLFRKSAVVSFLNTIDEACRVALESVFLEFKDHSRPIVETDVMLQFIEKAPAVFGDSWDKMCEWRGVKSAQDWKNEMSHIVTRCSFSCFRWHEWLIGRS